MKLEPYQIYQTSPPTSHQQQTGPPPPYYEAQYQRNNGLRTPSSASFSLPPTPQSANQQRCPIHGLQPCACQMVSRKFLANFSAREKGPQRRTVWRRFLRSAWQCCKINKYRDVRFTRTHVRARSVRLVLVWFLKKMTLTGRMGGTINKYIASLIVWNFN